MSGSVIPSNVLNNQAPLQRTPIFGQSLSGSHQDKGKLPIRCDYRLVAQSENINEREIFDSIENPVFGTFGSIDSSDFLAFCLNSYLSVVTPIADSRANSYLQKLQNCMITDTKIKTEENADYKQEEQIVQTWISMTDKQFKRMKDKAIKDLAFYAKAIEDGIITDDEYKNMPSAYKERAIVLQKIFTNWDKGNKDDAIVGEQLNIASYEDYLGVK